MEQAENKQAAYLNVSDNRCPWRFAHYLQMRCGFNFFGAAFFLGKGRRSGNGNGKEGKWERWVVRRRFPSPNETESIDTTTSRQFSVCSLQHWELMCGSTTVNFLIFRHSEFCMITFSLYRS